MKKATIILLMLLYLIPAIGVTVSVHYCGGRLASVSLNPSDTEHKCPCGSKKMKKDCCKDVVNTLELDDDQKRPQPMLLNIGAIAIAHHVVACTQAFNHKSPAISAEFEHCSHPPDDLKHPLYLRYQVFRI